LHETPCNADSRNVGEVRWQHNDGCKCR